MTKPKKRILDISPYRTGRSSIGGRADAIKLSSNENPFGASIKARSAFGAVAENLHRYPMGGSERLIDAIAEVHNFDAKNIICGSGSDELIKLICYAYLNEGDEVLYSEHGFIMYKIATLGAGATPIAVEEKDYTTQVDEIINAQTSKTKICFIANPNNPTGTYITKDEIIRLRQGLRADIMLVIDSAYAEYIADKDYTAGQDLVHEYENIVMLRTFSKAYGLAALRLGWAYANEQVLDILNRVRPPFNVNSAAQAAGVAALYDREYINQCIAQNNDIRSFLADTLKHNGVEVIPSAANFVLAKFTDKEKTAAKANEFLLSNGIIVRPVDAYGLADCLRISVGTEQEVKALVRAVANYMNI